MAYFSKHFPNPNINISINVFILKTINFKLGVTRYLQSKGGDQVPPTSTTTGGAGGDGNAVPTTSQAQAQTFNSGRQTTGMSSGDRLNEDVSATANSAQLVLPTPLFNQMRFTESNMVSFLCYVKI